MARLTRQTLSVFAGGASNQGTFGSAQAGSPAVSSSPTTVQSLGAWAAGWLDAVIGGQKLPPLEEFQGVQFVHSYMSAYLFQEGVPEYDAGTTYYNNAIVKKPNTFQLYGSVGAGPNMGNAITNPTYWTLLVDLAASIDAAYGVTAGGTTAYTVTTTPGVTTLATGQILNLKINAANTGAVTMAVGGGTPVAIVDRGGVALSGGELVANRTYPMVYNGTSLVLMVPIYPESSYGVTTNSGNTYSITTTPSFGILKSGQIIAAQINAANTGSITLNPNGIGATAVVDVNGNALASGALSAGQDYIFVYNGTSLVVFGTVTIKNVKTQIFTSSGTYTPSAGMVECIAEVQAPGGGGGGASTAVACGAGGGSGAYSKGKFTAATIGASQTITVGAAGTAGNNSGSNGGTGGTTSFGALISCTGGVGGTGSTDSAGQAAKAGGAGGTPTGGDVLVPGQTGGASFIYTSGDVEEHNGSGANSVYGAGGALTTSFSTVPGSAAGLAGTGYGAGGSGAIRTNIGGVGAPGIIYITEFCSQ